MRSGQFSLSTAAMLAALSLALSGCSGGGGDDDEEGGGQEIPEASVSGIWTGTFRIDGQTQDQTMRALVTEEGDYVVQSTGSTARLFIGSGASSSGNSFSANALAYSLTAAGKTPSSLQGTVVERTTITGSYSLTGESASFSLAYQPHYERAASLAVVAGVYSSTSTSIAVNSDGSFTLNMTNGCVMNGTFTVPTPTRNYYRWSGTFSTCGANNGPASGIAHLEDATPGTNNRLRLYGQNQTQTFAIVFSAVK